jgi:hypothetical protein
VVQAEREVEGGVPVPCALGVQEDRSVRSGQDVLG